MVTRFVLIGITALLSRGRDTKRVAALQMRAEQEIVDMSVAGSKMSSQGVYGQC